MVRPALEFFDPKQLSWQPHFVEGRLVKSLKEKVLSRDEETGAMTLMIKYPKGFRHPVLTSHTVTEEIYIVKGRISMEGVEYGQGYYAFRPVGMIHGEMEVLEETVLLIMLSGPLDYNSVEAKEQK